jgi:L-ribulose-5-phosphate 3-epimerase
MKPLQIGVCTWSLKIPDIDTCLGTIRDELGVGLVQIGFWGDEYKDVDRIRKLVEKHGIEVSATSLGFAEEDYTSIATIAATGGFKPDAYWAGRLAKATAYAEFTQALGVKLLGCHIGFVPHDKADPQYGVMVDRMKQVCDALGARGVTLVMETGQEKAQDLLAFIAAVGRPNIAINFDPANMILYGVGEPLEAITALLPKVVHCHMKDATWSKEPGKAWGEDVVLGTGQADIPRLVSKMRAGGYKGPLVVEREAGDNRLADVKEAIKLLKALVG